MKVIIFNSGLGNRMGGFTQDHHKSMAQLKNGETIFHRQLRLLSAEGVRDFIVTTGPFEEQLKEAGRASPGCITQWVSKESSEHSPAGGH